MEGARYIIVAAGDGTRWSNYLGIPKHLIPIGGEPLIHRTVRQLKEIGVTDIVIVAPDDDRYNVQGAIVYKPSQNGAFYDAGKFLSYREVWGSDTKFLFGDVYFTDDAIKAIVQYSGEWTVFARPTASNKTGCNYGEIFAMYIPFNHKAAFEASLLHIVKLRHEGKISRNGGWEVYRDMIGLPDDMLHRHLYGDNMVIIDDMTEDFDYPTDYELWKERLV